MLFPRHPSLLLVIIHRVSPRSTRDSINSRICTSSRARLHQQLERDAWFIAPRCSIIYQRPDIPRECFTARLPLIPQSRRIPDFRYTRGISTGARVEPALCRAPKKFVFSRRGDLRERSARRWHLRCTRTYSHTFRRRLTFRQHVRFPLFMLSALVRPPSANLLAERIPEMLYTRD